MPLISVLILALLRRSVGIFVSNLLPKLFPLRIGSTLQWPLMVLTDMKMYITLSLCVVKLLSKLYITSSTLVFMSQNQLQSNMSRKQWCHLLSSDTSIIKTGGSEYACVCILGEGVCMVCSCPKMKEESDDKNSQTWKRIGEEED